MINCCQRQNLQLQYAHTAAHGILHVGIKLLWAPVSSIMRAPTLALRHWFAAGEIPFHHSLARKVASLVASLPAMDTEQFTQEYQTVSAWCTQLGALRCGMIADEINQVGVESTLVCCRTHPAQMCASFVSDLRSTQTFVQ